MEDVSGNRLCGCRKQHFDSCPRRELLTLHTISKMPAPIKRAVTQRINITRQGPEQSRWKASTGAVICNVHYVDFVGPSRKNKNLVPVHFKKPNTSSNPPASKKSRVSTSSEEDMQDTTTGNQDEDLDDDLTLQTDLNVDPLRDTFASNQVSSPTGDLDIQPDTVGTSSTDLQQHLHSQEDSGTVLSSTQLINTEQCLEYESNSVDQGLPTGGMDAQPDTVGISSASMLPVQPQLCSLNTEDSLNSTNTQPVNFELCHESFSSNNFPIAVPPNDSSLDVASVISRCAQLEQENDELRAENIALKQKIETFNSSRQRLDLSLLTDCQVQMYTGLPLKVFECVLAWLNPVLRKKGALDELAPSQKLLMVMMRLRCNFPQNDLACRFNVEQSSVSRILNQWIPMLKVQLKSLIRWPQTTIGPTDPPYNLLPNSVAIIDGTEIFIQRPSNLATQKSSYSDYKSHTTVKYLVAIDTSTGVFVYISPGFSGNSSDRFTVQYSGILDELKPGQRILADKGYNARDLFAQKRCFLTIPSFLSEGRFTAQEGLQSRTIASARIRVENAIKRLKEYKALSETLSNRVNKKIVDDMVIVAGALCNLKLKLIK